MKAARYDQVYLVPVADNPARTSRGRNAQLVDREFGDEYRSDRMPAGWFILPSILIVVACMFIL